MRAPRSLRCPTVCLALVAALAPPAAHALLNIDGTRNQVFVFGQLGIGYDSNVFSDSSERDDLTITARAGAELKRRRGIIGVNAGVTVDYIHFDRFTDESGLNPDFTLQFIKTTGRTTGDISLRAHRENRADSAVNLRTTSWNIPLAVNIRYPVNEKLYLTSASGYLRRDYTENAALVDYADYSQAIDVFYVYNSRLDLVAGYRLRLVETTARDSRDHAFTLGATGALLPKVTGTVRLGYQLRSFEVGGGTADTDQLTVSAALSWVPTRKLSVALAASRDFNLTALGDSVDSLGASLHATYSFNRRLDLEAGLSYGRNRFLAGTATARTDDFLEWSLGARYTLNEHLTVAGTYSQLTNWSTIDFSDFDRTHYTLDLSSRF